jgi:hypothetical protein
VTISLTLPATPGAFTATAMTDSDCAIAEVLETDNTRTTTFTTSTIPPATSSLTGSPGQVVKGKTAELTVNATNVNSCTLTGTNGNTWTILPDALGNIVNAKRTTSALFGMTIFTLDCFDFGNNPLPSKKFTVRIAPTFDEF